MSIEEFVNQMNSPEMFLGGPELKIGKVYRHPRTKTLVLITDGQYLSGGRISNFWYWDVLDESKKPTGETNHGYGWTSTPIE